MLLLNFNENISYRPWRNRYIHVYLSETEMSCLPVKKLSKTYRQISNIRRILERNIIVDHSDVVGAPPAGAAPTTSSFST